MTQSAISASRRLELAQVMTLLRRHLPDLTQRYHIRSLGVFGSYVRNQQTAQSDLDVLVEFEHMPGLFGYVELQEALAELLGLPVDLVHRPDLKPGIGERILAEVVLV